MKGSSMIMRAAFIAAPLFVVMAIAACGDDAKDQKVVVKDSGSVGAHFVKRDTARVMRPGDIRIASADNQLEVSLVGDSLVAGLGPQARAKVEAATDTNAVTGSGMGASIEKMVKGAVAGALAHEMEFPLTDITDVRYEDGLLRFYDKDGRPLHLFENSRSGKKTSVTFRPEDAQAFIVAFKAKKGAAR